MAINICNRCLMTLTTAAVTLESGTTMTKYFGSYSHQLMVKQILRQGQLLRYLSTKVQTADEKKARQRASEEKTSAHKRYPFLPTKSTRQVYVLDKAVAAQIAKVVRKNQTDQRVPILEANPGPGVLTKALLDAGVERFVLAESLRNFMPYIEELQAQYPSNILAAYNWDYLSSWRRLVEATSAQKDYDDLLADIVPRKDWEDAPPLTVVAVMPSVKERPFLANLIMFCARQQGLFLLGRPEWFLAISPPVYKKILLAKADNSQNDRLTSLPLVLNMVFDIQLCAELPGWKFTPSFPEKRLAAAQKKGLQVSNSMRYLVRLRPRREQSMLLSEIPVFYSFLGQVMQKKKLRLIPKMEQLVPGCGIHLIMMHFTMMMLIEDVQPDQFVTIFKAMQEWPEYEGSPLKQFLTEANLSHVDDDSIEDTHKDS